MALKRKYSQSSMASKYQPRESLLPPSLLEPKLTITLRKPLGLLQKESLNANKEVCMPAAGDNQMTLRRQPTRKAKENRKVNLISRRLKRKSKNTVAKRQPLGDSEDNILQELLEKLAEEFAGNGLLADWPDTNPLSEDQAVAKALHEYPVNLPSSVTSSPIPSRVMVGLGFDHPMNVWNVTSSRPATRPPEPDPLAGLPSAGLNLFEALSFDSFPYLDDAWKTAAATFLAKD